MCFKQGGAEMAFVYRWHWGCGCVWVVFGCWGVAVGVVFGCGRCDRLGCFGWARLDGGRSAGSAWRPWVWLVTSYCVGCSNGCEDGVRV